MKMIFLLRQKTKFTGVVEAINTLLLLLWRRKLLTNFSQNVDLFLNPKEYKKYYIAALGGSYNNVLIPAGTEETFSFKCYNGPKIISQLAKFDKKGSGDHEFILGWTYGLDS